MGKRSIPVSDDYKEFCRLRKKLTDQRWQAANREAISAYHKAYYEAHREEIIKSNARWQSINRLARNKYKREWKQRQVAVAKLIPPSPYNPT